MVSGSFNAGNDLHLATTLALRNVDLADALFAAVGRKKAVEFIEMPPQLIAKYQYFTEARMDRLRQAGYSRPFTSLEDGVADYVGNYLATDNPYR